MKIHKVIGYIDYAEGNYTLVVWGGRHNAEIHTSRAISELHKMATHRFIAATSKLLPALEDAISIIANRAQYDHEFKTLNRLRAVVADADPLVTLANPMKWTTKYPDAAGWYWVRNFPFPSNVTIVHCRKSYDLQGVAFYMHYCGETFAQEECDGCEYAGPLTPPE